MAEVFKCPLTPVPLSLSHVNGAMMKTEKSKLLKLLKSLESKVVTQSPLNIHETVIDASFFLFLQSNLPTTFGHIAKVLLTKIMTSMGDTIHYLTDKWLNPSIKDNERDSQSSNNASYEIKGLDQKRASNWVDALTPPPPPPQISRLLSINF